MESKTILVLGGGIGGLVAANELRKRLENIHRVIVVEKNAQHNFAASFLWNMVGSRKAEQITRDMHDMVRPGVELVHAEVRSIDTANHRVEADSQTLTYDYLIVALGAELAPEVVPGLVGSAHTFYTLDGATKLREALESFDGGKVAIVVSAKPYKCPGAPYEGVMLINNFFRNRGLQDRVDIHLYTFEPQPMPVAGPELGNTLVEMLDSQGIAFHPLHKLLAVNSEAQELSFENREPVKYDLLVAIPPHRAPSIVREAGLANEAGWVPVDRETLETEHENVYAIGDVTALSIPGRWKPDMPLMLPKAGVFAHGQAKVVVQRIITEITGRGTKEVFCGDGYCMLEAGEAVAGFAYGDFFAEPNPQVELKKMGKSWHLGKVLFEKWWLAPIGLRRTIWGLTLKLGGKTLGIPVDL